MFGLGFSEILVLGVIALIVIGPDDLPRVARTLGRFMNELKRGGETFKKEFENSAKSMQEDLRIDPFAKPAVGSESETQETNENHHPLIFPPPAPSVPEPVQTEIDFDKKDEGQS